jgi:hypothetical protein
MAGASIKAITATMCPLNFKCWISKDAAVTKLRHLRIHMPLLLLQNQNIELSA